MVSPVRICSCYAKLNSFTSGCLFACVVGTQKCCSTWCFIQTLRSAFCKHQAACESIVLFWGELSSTLISWEGIPGATMLNGLTFQKVG